MVIVGILTWWYGAGWKKRMLEIMDHMASLVDYFSIDLLLKTLFSPYRQISAGRVQGPLGVQFRAFLDRIISRLIGAMIRMVVVFVGLVAIFLYFIIGTFLVILWGLIPVLPIFCIYLFMIGWVPWIL